MEILEKIARNKDAEAALKKALRIQGNERTAISLSKEGFKGENWIISFAVEEKGRIKGIYLSIGIDAGSMEDARAGAYELSDRLRERYGLRYTPEVYFNKKHHLMPI